MKKDHQQTFEKKLLKELLSSEGFLGSNSLENLKDQQQSPDSFSPYRRL